MRQREYTAAGGVVLDQSDRVLLIERWVERDGKPVHEVRLPKGHLDPGETDEQAALRETCEESGYCALEVLADLGTTVSEFEKTRTDGEREHVLRTEHYFLMRLTDERRGEPNFQSADEAKFRPRWVASPEDAEQRLTYDSEKMFMQRARACMTIPPAPPTETA